MFFLTQLFPDLPSLLPTQCNVLSLSLNPSLLPSLSLSLFLKKPTKQKSNNNINKTKNVKTK